MKLIIQIPCYNESETLEVALNALPKQLNGVDVIETLIIDDGSRDNTSQIARDFGVNHIVRFTKNKGLAYLYLHTDSHLSKQDLYKRLYL